MTENLFAGAASAQIRDMGEEMRFELWTGTKNRRGGDRAAETPSGSPVQAFARMIELQEDQSRGVARGMRVLHVDGAPFGSTDLTSSWRVTLPGETSARCLLSE